jgi:hypothetical protein
MNDDDVKQTRDPGQTVIPLKEAPPPVGGLWKDGKLLEQTQPAGPEGPKES